MTRMKMKRQDFFGYTNQGLEGIAGAATMERASYRFKDEASKGMDH